MYTMVLKRSLRHPRDGFHHPSAAELIAGVEREQAVVGFEQYTMGEGLDDGDAVAELRQLVVQAVNRADFGNALALVDDRVGDCEQVGHNLVRKNLFRIMHRCSRGHGPLDRRVRPEPPGVTI